jgi:hypothetical protein
MKSKIWPQRPQKWPLDLNDLGRGSMNFFKNYIFTISPSSWEKWAIAQLSSQTFKISNFLLFLGGLGGQRLKTSICKSLTRKPSYSSFFSTWCTDCKNVIFEKNHWAPYEVIEVKRSFSRSLRTNFGFHLAFTSFHLEFSMFWVSRLFDLGNLSNLRSPRMEDFNSWQFWTFRVSPFSLW